MGASAMARHPFQKFVVDYKAGDLVFKEGDPGTTMYIVQSGRVRLRRRAGTEQRTLGVMEKGDFFGEMSILEGSPRAMTAEVAEDAELIEINSTTFDKMIRGNIEIAIRLLRKLSIRLRDAENQIEELHAAGARAAGRPGPSSAGPSRRAVAADGGARLELRGDPPMTFPLGDSETLIGRYDPVTELQPDVDLTEADLKRTVSRRHARLIKDDQGWTVVEEVGALNGTFVNERRLVAGQPQSVVDGDTLTVGSVKLVFRA